MYFKKKFTAFFILSVFFSIQSIQLVTASDKEDDDDSQSQALESVKKIRESKNKKINLDEGEEDEDGGLSEKLGGQLVISEDEGKKEKKREKKACELFLARAGKKEVEYCYGLSGEGGRVPLLRDSTAKNLNHVLGIISRYKESKTHLVAQVFGEGENNIFRNPLCAKQFESLGIQAQDDAQLMDWASFNTNVQSNETFFIRKAKSREQGGKYGGHSEPQFVKDIDDIFRTRPDNLISLFIPEDSKKVYMCGLEVFAPYDACGDYTGKGSIGYNCVDCLDGFRKEHQEGQQSISGAVREELINKKTKFLGKDEDAFVLIYHAWHPYQHVSYEGKDLEGKMEFSLNSNANEPVFKANLNDDFDYFLLQHKTALLKPDALYKCLHSIGETKIAYDPTEGKECFPLRKIQ